MKLDWRGALGIALSALLLWWALRGEDLGRVWSALAASDWGLFLAATVAATLIFPLRARRWRTILDPVAPGLPFGPLWRATAVGMMVNNAIFNRAGEVARAYALTRETDRVPFATGLASIAVDRVFDAIVVLLLMFGAMLDPAFPVGVRILDQPVSAFARLGIVGVAGLLVGLYAIVFFPGALVGAFAGVARRVAPRVEARGVAALTAFAAGLGVLRHPARFAAVFGWTAAHWLLNALALWLGFRAVGIGVPFSAALFVQGLLSLAAALPSAPGFFGLFESAAKLGLAVYAVDATLAVSWALGFHILTFIPITVIGAVYFARLGVRMADVARAGAGS